MNSGWSLLRVELTLTWGFSIRAPETSAAQPALPLPPPSTLIGMLARGLASVGDWPELTDGASSAIRVARIVRSAHLGLLPGQRLSGIWSDLSRVSATPYLRPEHRLRPEMRFGVHAVGRVYAPDCRMKICYVIHNDSARDLLGNRWQENLCQGAFVMRAIGSKEGLLSVRKVGLEAAIIAENQEGQALSSIYYFPSAAVARCVPSPEELLQVSFWSFDERSPHWYATRREAHSEGILYCAPIYSLDLVSTKVKARLSDEGAALACSSEEFEEGESVFVLKRWLSS